MVCHSIQQLELVLLYQAYLWRNIFECNIVISYGYVTRNTDYYLTSDVRSKMNVTEAFLIALKKSTGIIPGVKAPTNETVLTVPVFPNGDSSQDLTYEVREWGCK